MESSNKGLVALLCVLGIVIIGLVVGIVVSMNMKSENSEIENSDTDEIVSMTNAPTEIDVMSTYGEELLTQKTAESFDLAMQYFDEKSQGAIDDDVYFNTESVRAYLLIENDYSSEAINFLDNIQVDRLSDSQTYTVYGYYRSAYRKMGSEAKANEYQEKMDLIKANSRSEI